jgi:hypothetical protein
MTPMYELAIRAFVKLAELRKAALQTKQPPQPIDIEGETTITNFKQGELP